MKTENGIIYARFSSYGQNEQSIKVQIRIDDTKEPIEKY